MFVSIHNLDSARKSDNLWSNVKSRKDSDEENNVLYDLSPYSQGPSAYIVNPLHILNFCSTDIIKMIFLQWKSEDKNRDLYNIDNMWGENFPDAILERSLMEKVSNIC